MELNTCHFCATAFTYICKSTVPEYKFYRCMYLIDCESCPIQCFRWVGVGDATGDYPFSHHKLTVQFSEASAAQDRKLEGLVHKAIRELWRPNPSQLTLLQTKGIGALHKEHPKACTLTGSSDPCYIEAYHLADPTDGRITLHLKVWPD